MSELERTLREAFEAGQPDLVWETAQELISVAGNLEKEAAQLRFKVNFGTEQCQNCTGLRAGPGIVATCYQIKQCFFTNLREGDLTSRQASILEHLGET